MSLSKMSDDTLRHTLNLHVPFCFSLEYKNLARDEVKFVLFARVSKRFKTILETIFRRISINSPLNDCALRNAIANQTKMVLLNGKKTIVKIDAGLHFIIGIEISAGIVKAILLAVTKSRSVPAPGEWSYRWINTEVRMALCSCEQKEDKIEINDTYQIEIVKIDTGVHLIIGTERSIGILLAVIK